MKVPHEITNTENTKTGYGITITWTKWYGKRYFASKNLPDFNEARRIEE